MENIVKYYIYLENQKRYSKYTIASYKADQTFFLEFIKKYEINYYEVDLNIIESFLAELYIKNYSKRSINRKISSIKSLYVYLCKNRIIRNNPFASINFLKTSIGLPKDLFYEQISNLLVASEKKPVLAIRNQTIILLLFSTGMRVSEIVNLDLSDVDILDLTLRIIGKGNKERRGYFSQEIAKILDEYVKLYRPVLLSDVNNNAFFINYKGQRLSVRSIEKIIELRGKIAPVPFKATPHMLRHTFATLMLNRGGDIKFVSELLGHASLSTTQLYTHISKARLKEVYENTHPLAINLKKKINSQKQ